MAHNGTTTEVASKKKLFDLYKQVVTGGEASVFDDESQLEQKAQAFVASKAAESASAPAKYICSTEKPVPPPINHDPNALWVGFLKDIPRWKAGSVVNFATNAFGYPTTEQAAYAASEIRRAAAEWNSVGLGVTLQWVPRLEDAAFLLAYGGHQGTVLAEAFFPDGDNINMVWVYDTAFTPQMRPILKNIFLHELGHVLGLRHEFANVEGGAVQWGQANPRSVMSYTFPPTMQESDKVDARSFYAYRQPNIGIYPLVDIVPDN